MSFDVGHFKSKTLEQLSLSKFNVCIRITNKVVIYNVLMLHSCSCLL